MHISSFTSYDIFTSSAVCCCFKSHFFKPEEVVPHRLASSVTSPTGDKRQNHSSQGSYFSNWRSAAFLSQLVAILNWPGMALLTVGGWHGPVTHSVSIFFHHVVRSWRVVMDIHRVFVILPEAHTHTRTHTHAHTSTQRQNSMIQSCSYIPLFSMKMCLSKVLTFFFFSKFDHLFVTKWQCNTNIKPGHVNINFTKLKQQGFHRMTS